MPVWEYGDVWAKRIAAICALVGKITGEVAPEVVIVDWLAPLFGIQVQTVAPQVPVVPVRIAVSGGIEVMQPDANGKETRP